ncbi:MAG: D-alanine--D-alanine ligase [Phycisphaerales bacterium]|nr:D-alanine--D-alanine ligase [Phycisphaerales bacterium]
MHAAADPPPSAARALRITLLRGGPGPERSVSFASGTEIAAALRRRGHTVLEADIAPDNLSALDAPADLIFIGLHGEFGEDGTLQRILEQRGLKFTGSGSAASALAMNKIAAKRIAQQCGAQTAAWRHIRSPEWPALRTAAPADLIAPLVVKPVASGSSVETHVLQTADRPAVFAAIERVLAAFGEALVEQFISGQEATVAVLEGRALPPIVIRPRAQFYDFRAKYEADDTEYLFDALPPAVLQELLRRSEALFAGLGCRHLARVDWIVDAAGVPWFLEANTLPGFTSHSLAPKAAARAGIGFDELCDRLARLALESSE